MDTMGLPVAISDFPYDAKDRAIGCCSKLPNQIGEELRSLADDLLEIGRNLSGHCEQNVRVLIQHLRQSHDLRFRRWRLLSPLYLAEVGRFDSDSCCDFSDRELAIFFAKLFAAVADEGAEYVVHSV